MDAHELARRETRIRAYALVRALSKNLARDGRKRLIRQLQHPDWQDKLGIRMRNPNNLRYVHGLRQADAARGRARTLVGRVRGAIAADRARSRTSTGGAAAASARASTQALDSARRLQSSLFDAANGEPSSPQYRFYLKVLDKITAELEREYRAADVSATSGKRGARRPRLMPVALTGWWLRVRPTPEGARYREIYAAELAEDNWRSEPTSTSTWTPRAGSSATAWSVYTAARARSTPRRQGKTVNDLDDFHIF